MESKKNLSGFFRESLGQLDREPSGKVWEQIESDLDKKKKKRRLLLWFFFPVLLTAFLTGGYFYTATDPHIMNIDGTTSPNTIETTGKNNPLTTAGKSETNPADNDDSHTNNSSTNISHSTQKTNAEKPSTFNEANTKKENGKSNIKTTSGRKNTNLASIKPLIKKKRKSKKNSSSDQYNETALITGNNKNGSAKIPSAETQNFTVSEPVKTNLVDSLIAAKTDLKKEKKNTKEKDSLPKDSTAITEEDKGYRITIAPYYGLNYGSYFGTFDALSKNQILENKPGMRSTYGVLLRWMFDRKIGIQTGAGKINSRYFSTVDKPSTAFINTQNVATDIPVNQLEGIFATATKVEFTYESSYIEVPIEGYYVVRDQKLGVAASLGVSLLFGGKNSVYAASENIPQMKIGQLETSRPSSITGNAKLYLFYKITPSLQWDLYPCFQYQVMGNTDASGYSGYFFSVRTGLSYKL